MKTPHSEKRQQVWLAAWVAYTTASNSTNVDDAAKWADRAVYDFDERFPLMLKLKSEKPKKDKSAEKMFLDSHNVLLKIRNHVAPNTPLNDELFIEVKNNLKDLKDYMSFVKQIKNVFPSMSDDLLLMTIKNNLESNFKLMKIEKYYDVTWSEHSVLATPKASKAFFDKHLGEPFDAAKIIKERYTFNPLPPEYPNGDSLSWHKGTQDVVSDEKTNINELGCSDPNCIVKDCGHECKGRKHPLNRETPDRDDTDLDNDIN